MLERALKIYLTKLQVLGVFKMSLTGILEPLTYLAAVNSDFTF